jgi:hypothetical protein
MMSEWRSFILSNEPIELIKDYGIKRTLRGILIVLLEDLIEWMETKLKSYREATK